MASYEVVILKSGYTKNTGHETFRSCGSITLLKGKNIIVVDTGSPWEKNFLIDKLKENGLQVSDVNYVICTHGHLDHAGNLNLFPNATFIVSYDVCHGNEYTHHSFEKDIPYEIDDRVEVVATPGHTTSDVSVLVTDSNMGNVAITGDLFECEEDINDPSLWQQFSENPELQQSYRDRILNFARVIVPGHGPPFTVIDSYKRQNSRCDTCDDDATVGDSSYNVEEAE